MAEGLDLDPVGDIDAQAEDDVLPDQHIPDADHNYRPAAANLWESGRTGVPNVMPLYPLLVALTGPGFGQLAADIALTTGLIWLAYTLTLAMFADRAAALLAAA